MAEGTTVANIICKSLLSFAGQRSSVSHNRPLRERLAELAREVDAVPPKSPPDTRTAEEIIGYDESGQW